MSEEKKVQAQGVEEKNTPVQALDDIEMIDVDENLKKYDSESVMVENKGFVARFVTVLAVAMSLFHLYLASPWGTMPSAKSRAIHLGFVLALIFLNVPIAKKKDGTLV